MNELMWREMQAQPDDLAAALPELRRQATSLSSLSPERVLLTGSGDSLFAALSLEMAYGLELGRPVWAMPSAAAARYGSGRLGGLTIVISVSGEVRRTIEAAMSAHIAGGKVLAVTSGAESTLAREADAVIVMPQPITRTTPHTRDYTTTLRRTTNSQRFASVFRKIALFYRCKKRIHINMDYFTVGFFVVHEWVFTGLKLTII